MGLIWSHEKCDYSCIDSRECPQISLDTFKMEKSVRPLHVAQVTKKRKFVAEGIFYAELNEFLTRELAEDNFGGLEVEVY